MAPTKSTNGPSVMRTVSPRSRAILTRPESLYALRLMSFIWSSSSGTGRGRLSRSSSVDTNPVTPGVFRTAYQLSSSIVISTKM